MAPSRNRKRARPGEGPRLRAELLAAAEHVLDEQGEEALTVRGIATLVGVTTPSVYLHFESRLDLLHAVCLRVWDHLEERMREAVAGTDDPFTALYRRCAAYISFGLEHPLRYRLVMNGPASEATRQVAADSFRHLAEAVEPCVASGALRGDVVELTRNICAGLHGAVALLVQQPPATWPKDLAAYTSRAAATVSLGAAALGRLPDPVTTATTATLTELFGAPSAPPTIGD
ncbi:TetR/AcrR family transcriptional regulator [Wenjunlia tyrosinilytica]|uniref:Transcriptional regulator, TetR family protein n=1 Tax=Wenjunlia tyrosinilytica TaxID=1544741 RepID=A0A918E2H6_9ACTN|nr:TetR/AcrR family transcriptional regulator [Wenjunlia tyrosinilytica]GGO99437.1 putative transcriptional regulator, TetR family protein [Wenjunlia tyrosinilytica]